MPVMPYNSDQNYGAYGGSGSSGAPSLTDEEDPTKQKAVADQPAKPSAPAPYQPPTSPTDQTPQTFTQLQQQGVARPPDPSQALASQQGAVSAPSGPAPYSPSVQSGQIAAQVPSSAPSTVTPTPTGQQAQIAGSTPAPYSASTALQVDPSNPNNYLLPQAGGLPPLSIPKMNSGESTQYGGYAQDNAGDIALNQSGGNYYRAPDGSIQTQAQAIAPQQKVIQALGTAANVWSGTAGPGTAGINSGGVQYMMNPDGTFTGAGQTLSADQLKQIIASNGQAGVQQHIDTPQGGLTTPTQADMPAGSVLAGNTPISQATFQGTPVGTAPTTGPAGSQTAVSGLTQAQLAANTVAQQNGQPLPNPSSLQTALASAAAPTGAAPTTSTPSAGPQLASQQAAIAAPTGPAGGVTTPANAPALSASSATPSSSTGGTNDVLNALLTGVAGKGAGSDVQNATQAAILKQLQNPNPYLNDAVAAQEKAGNEQISQQESAAQKKLDEYLASRGIAASSFGGGYQGDLAGQFQTARDALQGNILTDMAAKTQAGTGQAIAQGTSGATSAQNNQQSWLNQLMGYGQQVFNNDLATNQVNNQQQQSYQNLLLQLLLAGYSGGATA